MAERAERAERAYINTDGSTSAKPDGCELIAKNPVFGFIENLPKSLQEAKSK